MSETQTGEIAADHPTDPTTPGEAKKRRGRPAGKAADAKQETPQQRIDRLKSELRQAEQAKREFDAKRDSVVGQIVVSHALADPTYRRQLATLLRDKVDGKADLALLAELLG